MVTHIVVGLGITAAEPHAAMSGKELHSPLMLRLCSLAAATELRKGGPNTREWDGSALRLN